MAAIGVALPFIGPLARLLGFRPLPLSFLAVLVGMIILSVFIAPYYATSIFPK